MDGWMDDGVGLPPAVVMKEGMFEPLQITHDMTVPCYNNLVCCIQVTTQQTIYP